MRKLTYLAATSLGLSAQAYAQDQADEPAEAVEDGVIVVSATRTPTPITAIPNTVKVINRLGVQVDVVVTISWR